MVEGRASEGGEHAEESGADDGDYDAAVQGEEPDGREPEDRELPDVGEG